MAICFMYTSNYGIHMHIIHTIHTFNPFCFLYENDYLANVTSRGEG